MKLTEEQAKWYLAGMIDGEGHVTANPTNRYREIQVSNSDYELIEAVAKCCDVLGYHYSIRKPVLTGRSTRVCWVVAISQRSTLIKTIELPIQASRKQTALAALIDSYAPDGVSKNSK